MTAAEQKRKAWSVVIVSTLAFTVCFMVWMMFAIIGIPIKKELGLNETQFGLLVAMPVLTGSLIRLPLGMLTDQFGGRIVVAVLMASTVVPIYFISFGTENPQLCFLYTLTDSATGRSFKLYQRFVFNLSWSPEQFREITHDPGELIDSGELEMF